MELLNGYSKLIELQAPSLFISHSRDGLEELEHRLPYSITPHFSMLAGYVIEQYAGEYEGADY